MANIFPYKNHIAIGPKHINLAPLKDRLIQPAFGNPTQYSLGITLKTAISRAGLTNDCKLILDAGDRDSFQPLQANPQKWLDVSGNGEDFFLGATGSASTDDFSFQGSPGSPNKNTYWIADGGDFFRYDTTPTTWMNNLHKDNARFSWFMLIFVPSNIASSMWSTRHTSSGYGAVSNFVITTGQWNMIVLHASGEALRVTSDAPFPFGKWVAIGGSINEPAGAGGSFLWRDGSYETVSGASVFNATYTSPTTSDTNRFDIMGGLPGDSASPSGTRIQAAAFWEGSTRTKKELDTLYSLVRSRL